MPSEWSVGPETPSYSRCSVRVAWIQSWSPQSCPNETACWGLEDSTPATHRSAFQEIVEAGGLVAGAMIAFRAFLGENDMFAYRPNMGMQALAEKSCLVGCFRGQLISCTSRHRHLQNGRFNLKLSSADQFCLTFCCRE